MAALINPVRQPSVKSQILSEHATLIATSTTAPRAAADVLALPHAHCRTTEATSVAPHPHNHRVQFYDDEDHLFKAVSDFFAPFFDNSGEVGLIAIILARPHLIRCLEDLFRAKQYKSKFPGREHIYGSELLSDSTFSTHNARHVLFVDAFKVVDKLVTGSEMQYRDFENVMDEILSQFQGMDVNETQQLALAYAYGELVDILCERDQHLLSFELEGFWNTFLTTRHISLLCGYKMEFFKDQALAPVFQSICHSHAIVSPAESYSTVGTAQEQMAMVAAVQQNFEPLQAAIGHQQPWLELDEQQARYQEQVVDSLCHELRNPLSGIIGNVEILQTGLALRQAILSRVVDAVGDSKILDSVSCLRNQWTDDTESIDAIGICAEHMKNVTDDLLTLSKIECGKIILENVPFDPRAAISSVIKMFSTLAKQKGIQLLFDRPEESLVVMGDSGRLTQIIINLISNALKFTDSGSITVGFRCLGPRNNATAFEVAIRDTGKGISDEEKTLLFRRFAQPKSTTFTKYGGSGLGLYISKCLVELMGGVLSVESQRGQGSTFVFSFQAEELRPGRVESLLHGKEDRGHQTIDTTSSERDTSLSAVSYPTNGRPAVCPSSSSHIDSRLVKQVLLVDDNLISLRVVLRLLDAEAISVITASNGYEAIGKLISLSRSETPIDMVLMDLDMPFMGGVSAARHIRRLKDDGVQADIFDLAKVPIIGMTAHVRREKYDEARLAGMDDCIAKPISRKVLMDLIKRVLDRPFEA
jgi:signal transduction histidine kinase/CheY-like chemotaxis protein